jgi:D-alanyl-D-alanine carboxypeptidase
MCYFKKDDRKQQTDRNVQYKKDKMKINFILTLLTLTVTSFGYAQTPPANIANGINSLFQDHVNQSSGLVPGHVIRIEKPGSWVYENSAGLASVNPATNTQANMKFKIASITKMFTTVAIFKLIQNGQVNFNAPISTYLPLSVVQGFDNFQNITVKRLLNHTSGITDPQNDFQGRLNYWIYMKRFEDIPVDSLIFWSYASPAGVGNYSYSNSNFYLLAEIIKSVSGGSYQDYVTNNIINPLGLTNTDFNTYR